MYLRTGLKTGRLPRKHDPRVPHYSALITKAINLPPIPKQVDNGKGLDDWGMMLNDTLGDCTCAAVYHSLQTWTLANGALDTEPDSHVLNLYESACGYIPGNALTDEGGVEQDVLKYWASTGIQRGNGIDKLTGFVEIDPRQLDDVQRGIWECGVVYIGFGVPKGLIDDGNVPEVWELPKNPVIEGGHAVILNGYQPAKVQSGYGATIALDARFTVISWGDRYEMTEPFFAGLTDEVYGLVSADWVDTTGKTPAGLGLEEIEEQMKYAVEVN